MRIFDTIFTPVVLQELDGSSVLVMQRRDIISGLGLKLGPALKIYNRVRTLQLRRKIEF